MNFHFYAHIHAGDYDYIAAHQRDDFSCQHVPRAQSLRAMDGQQNISGANSYPQG